MDFPHFSDVFSMFLVCSERFFKTVQVFPPRSSWGGGCLREKFVAVFVGDFLEALQFPVGVFWRCWGSKMGCKSNCRNRHFFRTQIGSVRWFCSISLGPNGFEPHHTHVRRCLESFSVPRWAFFARTWAHACGLESSSLNHWLPCPEHKISPKARWHVWNLNSLSDLGAGINRPLWLEPADYIETFGALWLLFWFR